MWAVVFQSLEWLDTSLQRLAVGQDIKGLRSLTRELWAEHTAHSNSWAKALVFGAGICLAGADRAIVARKGLRLRADSWNHISEARHEKAEGSASKEPAGCTHLARSHPSRQEESGWP